MRTSLPRPGLSLLLAVGLLINGSGVVWLVKIVRAQPPAPAAVALPVPTPTPALMLPMAAVSASPAPAPTARPVPYAAVKASFRVTYANYGVYSKKQKRGRMIEVTDLVQDLLRHRGWLKVNPAEMKGDPWPGKDKWLYMEYEVMGKAAVIKRKEHAGLTLHQLIKHAGVLPATAPDETPPPGVTDSDGGAGDDGDSSAPGR